MSGTIVSVLLEVRSVCQSVFLITHPQPVVAIQDQNRFISTVFMGKNMAGKQPNTHEQLSIRILSHQNCNNSWLEVHFQCKKPFWTQGPKTEPLGHTLGGSSGLEALWETSEGTGWGSWGMLGGGDAEVSHSLWWRQKQWGMRATRQVKMEVQVYS